MLLGCAIYGFQALDAIYWRWEFLEARDITPGLPNVRLFSDIAAGLMPLALLYVTARSVPSRVAALLCLPPLAVWWYLLFVTEARAGILALVSAMAVAVWLFGRQARFPVATLSVAALVGLLGWWLYNPLLAEGAESPFQRDLTTSSGRLDLWADALRYSIEHFPFGIGPMMFAGDGQIRSASAHNLFLNTAAEWGLPLALLLLALVVKGCFVIARRARTMPVGDKPLYACLVMAFVGVMVNVQFSGAHIAPLSSLVMVLAIGLVFGHRHSGLPPPKKPAGSPPWPVAAKVLGALLVVCMVYLAVAGWELYELSVASTRVCMQEAGRAYLYPRFWAQGRLECMQLIDPDHWLFWNWR
ncbi:O-antigen ligase family protein [Billgrantia gudaonensis]|uniref:O-antigen ligase like membrane protein n=1 Tax=Billgrantia gudaonensis TaxID=376427 RepID=A0A1G8VFY4_9GAMM|nr:O-antigen ligase family protein [Halomonas gudaonensis]SDJ64804.1 O-antigen ligase like membrane protein [Halomonas gudaonensis]